MTAPPGARSLDPTARDLWRAARVPLFVVALILLTALGLAILASGSKAGLLDPRAVDRSGSKAIAQLLRDQGVTVDLVRTTDAAAARAGRGTTLLVAFPDLLVPSQLDRVAATSADLVLVAPAGPALERLAPGVLAVGQGDGDTRSRRCDLPAAVRAGRAEVAGVLYAAAPGTELIASCYPSDGRPGLLAAEFRGRPVTILGDPTPLANDRLDDEGNAALAMNLLGTNPALTWYLPSTADVPAGERRSFYQLVPDGVWYGTIALVVAVVLLALWRMRRLGPVVAERLPVVIRAAETVEGRARLYQRARARDRAAGALREAAVSRLLAVLGLPRGSGPDVVVDAVAARTGRSHAELAALLYGAAPADDPGLVRIAHALDQLETEVRRS